MPGGNDRGDVSRAGLMKLEKEWKDYQSLSKKVQSVQRREVGILGDAKSGKGFYKYVVEEINKAQDKTVCANNIAKEVLKNNLYLFHAATDLDGRRALQHLSYYARISDDGQAESETLTRALELYNKEASTLSRQLKDSNEEAFISNFPEFSKQFDKKAEEQGYEITRSYYQPFTSSKYEIRAVVKQYRKDVMIEVDGKKTRLYIGEKDIRIGGYDPSTGDFLPASAFDKHGTAESSLIQADDILIIGTIAKGIGELFVKGIGKIASKEASSLAIRMEGKLAEEGMLEAAKTEKVLAGKLGGASTRDTLQDLGDTLDLKKLSPKELSITKPPIDLPKELSITKPPLTYWEAIRKSTSIDPTEKRIAEDISGRLKNYGIKESDVLDFIDSRKIEGLPINKIEKELNENAKLIDYFRVNFCKGDAKAAGAAIEGAGGVRHALIARKQMRLWTDWKTRNPTWGGLPDKQLADNWRFQLEKAKNFIGKLESSVLKSSMAFPLISEAKASLESKDTKKTREESALKKAASKEAAINAQSRKGARDKVDSKSKEYIGMKRRKDSLR
jgi:hypothetical protein